MLDNKQLDEIRIRIQKSLVEAQQKRSPGENSLESERGTGNVREAGEGGSDFIEEFDRQFSQAKAMLVRERIGNPAVQPAEEIPPDELPYAVDRLLNLLYEHAVIVDFLGEWDDLSMYNYLTEELLDFETSDMRVEGLFSRFIAATTEYDLQMWAEHFVQDVFRHERNYFLTSLKKLPLSNLDGEPMAVEAFIAKLEALWALLPATKMVHVQPLNTKVAGEQGTVIASVVWTDGDSDREMKVDSTFWLKESPYSGWDVVATSMLDDILTILK